MLKKNVCISQVFVMKVGLRSIGGIKSFMISRSVFFDVKDGVKFCVYEEGSRGIVGVGGYSRKCRLRLDI